MGKVKNNDGPFKKNKNCESFSKQKISEIKKEIVAY